MILPATRIVLSVIMFTPHVTRSQGSDTPDPVGRFISDRSRMAPPSKEECDKLFLEMSKGSDEARKELIERHIRLVASIALKFRQTNVQMEDIKGFGFQFRSTPVYTNKEKKEGMMTWALSSILTSVKELWHEVDSKPTPFLHEGAVGCHSGA